MNISKYLDEMKQIQSNILKFIEDDGEVEENYQNMIQFFVNEKIQSNEDDLKMTLRLIAHLSNNFYHCKDFFSKIEKILQFFTKEIKSKYSNQEIFDIFKKNKRILLFLITEQIIILNISIIQIFYTDEYLTLKYPQYFAPEIKSYLDQHMDEGRKIPNYRKYIINEIPENFEENRKKGENEEYICQIIRNDSIEDFITYVNKHFISINSTISKSIYETNNFLLKINKQTTNKEITLIEYSAFYGSVQIFKYLQLNKAEFNSNLLLFAIHGNHPEIISILENNQIKPNTYKDCFKEAIKCHFNSIADYIYNNHIKNEELHEFAKFFLKSFNFSFIKKEYCEPILFYYLCKYDYSSIVAFLLENKNIDANEYHIKREKKSNKICPFYQYEETSFHQAVVKNNFATVKLLLKNDKVDVNFPLIIKSYENESYENENDEDFDECMKVKEVTPLISAIKQENIEMVRLLLSCENVKVNYYIESKFTNGKCKFDDVDNDNWRSLNVNGEWKKKSALIVAVLKGNVEIVRLLLENKRINPNSLYEEIDMKGIESSTDYFHKNEKTPLNIAVSNRNIEIVKLLLNHEKIDPNICSIKEKDWESFVKEMSESSDDVIPEIGRFDDRCELILSKYKTALNLAIKNCSLNMVKILLENKKVDINKINYSYLNETIEKTALLYAIEKNQIDIVKLLLEQEKIDLNIKCAISDEEKTTALLYAIDKKNVDIVKLLLEQKNLGLDDKMKAEAREYALQTDNQEIISLFKEEEKKMKMMMNKMKIINNNNMIFN